MGDSELYARVRGEESASFRSAGGNAVRFVASITAVIVVWARGPQLLALWVPVVELSTWRQLVLFPLAVLGVGAFAAGAETVTTHRKGCGPDRSGGAWTAIPIRSRCWCRRWRRTTRDRPLSRRQGHLHPRRSERSGIPRGAGAVSLVADGQRITEFRRDPANRSHRCDRRSSGHYPVSDGKSASSPWMTRHPSRDTDSQLEEFAIPEQRK
jgi:hypothetical protein